MLFYNFFLHDTHEIFHLSCLLTSERILNTLVKVNRPSLLIESCSAGPELLRSRFS